MTQPLGADELLAKFAEHANPGAQGVPCSAYFPGTQPDAQHVVFGFAIHGNEHGTLPAALQLLRELTHGDLVPTGPITLLVGNPRAIRADVRFIDEDLNRVFTFDKRPDTWERERAQQLRPALDSADIFLDFHQTQTETPTPFWTFPWDQTLADWARVVAAAPVGLTRAPGGAFSPGKCCADEYVRARGKVGFTVEVGTKGQDPQQSDLVYRAARRLLRAIESIDKRQASLSELATEEPPIEWYETRQVLLAASPQDRLRPGLHNWLRVQKGELVSAEGAPEHRASADGYLLFPKYPGSGEPPPPELARLGVRLQGPAVHYAAASK